VSARGGVVVVWLAVVGRSLVSHRQARAGNEERAPALGNSLPLSEGLVSETSPLGI
jgi:hypothetical protein